MAADPPLTLEWLPGRYAVCRLDAAARLPIWITSSLALPASGLLSLTRTERELSIVIDESLIPASIDSATTIQRGFIALRIAGTLDFSLVGILAKLTGALAQARVSVFAISTHDTDILLVREGDRDRAALALQDVAGLNADRLW